MDTVKPNSGWQLNPIKPEVIDNKIYGLGTTDMKAGLSLMQYFATCANLKPNVGFLFYCDEEYDFLGMKTFIKKYKNKIKPKLLISLDGEGCKINNSCRGLIELKINVSGKAGHAANPKSGINAITQSFKVIGKLEKWLTDFKSQELGKTTLNIAYIQGGGSEGNIIPEKCEYVAEIRVASDKLNAKLVKDFVIKESKKRGLKIIKIDIRHDLASWITNKNDLLKLVKLPMITRLKNTQKGGYIDIQMLWQTFGKIPAFSFGIGESKMSHKANEYITISNIMKGKKFFEKILLNDRKL
jgi:acetylornithine deacetylase/succinyl-diaminopimelate desuccinylase-like protein